MLIEAASFVLVISVALMLVGGVAGNSVNHAKRKSRSWQNKAEGIRYQYQSANANSKTRSETNIVLATQG